MSFNSSNDFKETATESKTVCFAGELSFSRWTIPTTFWDDFGTLFQVSQKQIQSLAWGVQAFKSQYTGAAERGMRPFSNGPNEITNFRDDLWHLIVGYDFLTCSLHITESKWVLFSAICRVLFSIMTP